LLLRKFNALGKDVLRSSTVPIMKAGFGTVIDCFGNKIKGSAGSVYDIDMTKSLPKTSAVARTLVRTQLPTGHMRLDLAQPLTQGNFILFKGERNLGKTRLAVSTISQFLQKDPSNRAIYVGLSKSNSVKAFDQLDESLRERACFFTMSGEDTTISNAEYFLAPK
jgi:F0F1-type ATP synthase alpha subunit